MKVQVQGFWIDKQKKHVTKKQHAKRRGPKAPFYLKGRSLTEELASRDKIYIWKQWTSSLKSVVCQWARKRHK